MWIFLEPCAKDVYPSSCCYFNSIFIRYIYIYIENTIPREKRASIEMLIDRNVEIKQDLRISLPLRGSLGPGSSQLPKTFELYLLVRVLGSNNNYRQSRDNFRQRLRKFLTRIPMIFRQVLYKNIYIKILINPLIFTTFNFIFFFKIQWNLDQV